MQNAFTLEKGVVAQRMCDRGLSNDRIAAELDVTRYVIDKWISLGLLKVKYDANRRKTKEEVRIAQKLLKKNLAASVIAERVKVDKSTINRWKRQGKIR
jgi:transposase